MNRYLQISESVFRENFDHAPFLIEHNLVTHPLFQLSKLIELSQRLPDRFVEYNAGNVPISLDPSKTPRTGLSIEETIRRIEEHNSWLVLKNVEQDPEYRELLDQCLDEVMVFSESIRPGMTKREGFIFISSVGAITPLHIDPEHNFLLHIRGDKEVTQFDRKNREVLSEQSIEQFYLGGHRNLKYKDEFAKAARVFKLAPGQGLHFPINAPHWVKVGNTGYSISFSITFRSAEANRRECIYRVNGKMREKGISPTPYGDSPLVDTIKYLPYQVLRLARKSLGR